MNDPCFWRLHRGIVVILWSVLIAAGCAAGPDYKRPPSPPIPAQWKAPAPWKEAQPRDTEIKQHFWELFDDPVLTALEEQATTNSPDIHAAFLRVEQSRAVARISRADLMPRVTLDPSGNRARYSPSRVVQPGALAEPYTSYDFVLPLDLSYEVDLWGRVRRSFRAAGEQAQASAAAYQNLLLSLQAEVAQTYFMIRSIDLDRNVVSRSIDLRKKNLDLVDSLHRG